MAVSKLCDGMKLRGEPALAQGARQPSGQFSWTY